MYKSSYTLWSMWPSLSYLSRLFVLILAIVVVYSIASAVVIWKGLRALGGSGQASDQARIAQLSGRCANLGQVLGATFFLFGFLFFVGLPNATITIGDGRGFPASEILNNFVLHFVYAANIFLVFLILHLIQWLTSHRLYAFSVRHRDSVR